MTHFSEFSKQHDELFEPSETERDHNAEFTTPYQLRQDMLDKIPHEFWTTPKTVFEPCCGKGGFVIDIIDCFMNGLIDYEPDPLVRYDLIVAECVYFADINEENVNLCISLVGPNCNAYNGDTLNMDASVVFPELAGGKFDAVVGNPPFNPPRSKPNGSSIWHKFVIKAFNEWTNRGGYLCFVHPTAWRRPVPIRSRFYGLFDLMTRQNSLLYLSIHGMKESSKVFKAETRYDWYVIRLDEPTDCLITVRDGKGIEHRIDFPDHVCWIPNYDIPLIFGMVGDAEIDDMCPLIKLPRVYSTTASKVLTDTHIYPCVHTTPKRGTRFLYTDNTDKGGFGIPKIIFGDGGGLYDVIIDMDGTYGMTGHAIGIEVASVEEANGIKSALLSERFKGIVKAIVFSGFQIDRHVFRTFRRDFWREFINIV